MAAAPLPPSHIAPLPQSLTYTPSSSTFPTSASSSSVPPLSASSISTNFKFGTPPPISPTTGIFARRGSILPRVGDISKSTPSRNSRMDEEVEMHTVKPMMVDEAKIKEEQAMAKWRVSPPLATSQAALSKIEMGSRATTSGNSNQTNTRTFTIPSSTETTHNHQRFSRYITSAIPSKLSRFAIIPKPLRTLTQRSSWTEQTPIESGRRCYYLQHRVCPCTARRRIGYRRRYLEK